MRVACVVSEAGAEESNAPEVKPEHVDRKSFPSGTVTAAGCFSECRTNPSSYRLPRAGKAGFRYTLHERFKEAIKSQYVIFEIEIPFIHSFENSLSYMA